MEIDLTHERISKKRRISRCPKCGRKGEIAHYQVRGQLDGSGRCFHKLRRESYGLVVTDGCFWPATGGSTNHRRAQEEQ